ncbi:MAG: hypothetical protein ACMUHB_06980, partial [Thermoplasmatota archaeon]
LRTELTTRLQEVMGRLDSMDSSMRSLVESMWEDFNSTSATREDMTGMAGLLLEIWANLNGSISDNTSRTLQEILFAKDSISENISDLRDHLEGKIELEGGDLIDKIENLWLHLNTTSSSDLSLILSSIGTSEKNLTGKMILVQEYIEGRLNLTRDKLSDEVRELYSNFTGILEMIDKAEDAITGSLTKLQGSFNGTIQMGIDEIEGMVQGFYDDLNLSEGINLTTIVGSILKSEENLTEVLDDLRMYLSDRMNLTSQGLHMKLERLNTTLVALLEQMLDAEGNLTGELDTLKGFLDGRISLSNAQLKEVLSTLWSGLNTSQAADLSSILRDLGTTEGNLSTEIGVLKDFLNGKIDMGNEELKNRLRLVWEGLNTTLSVLESDLDNRISDLENSISSDHDVLRQYIGIRSDQMELYLGIVNTTIHYHLNSIETEMLSFRSDTTLELSSISDMLRSMADSRDEDHDEIILALENTEDLINDLSNVNMLELRSRLTDLQTYISGFNSTEGRRKVETLDQLLTRLEELDSNVSSHLENISVGFEELAKLDDLINEMERIDEGMDKTNDLQEDNDGSLRFLLIMILIAAVIILGFLAFLVYREVKEKEETW